MPHLRIAGISFWLISLMGLSCEQPTPLEEANLSPAFPVISGVNYSQTQFLPDSGVDLTPVSAQWISLVPQYFGRQRRPIITRQFRWEDLIPEAILQARDAELFIMVKPHIDFDNNRIFRGDFTLDTEADWREFENRYAELVLEMADLCQVYQVEILCIGTELRTFATQRSEYWKELIRQVRGRYSGKLVYAANWDEYHLIPFWEELDYIGINAYFPLSRTPVPSPEELKQGWIWYADAMAQNQAQWGKPVLFTEYGYRSIEQATWKHWELGPGTPSEAVQSRGYAAFFETFWEKRWVAGGFLWEWVPQPPRGANTRWTPQGKAAEAVIKEWYQKK